MNDHTMYDAVSGIDEKYLEASEDGEAVKAAIRSARRRRVVLLSVCACVILVVCVVGPIRHYLTHMPGNEPTHIVEPGNPDMPSVPDEPEVPSNPDWNPHTGDVPPMDIEAEPVSLIFSSVDELHEAITAVKTSKDADSSIRLSSLDSVYYPALGFLDGYQLYQIEVSQQRIIYYFMPIDSEEDIFVYENGITVTFKRTDGEQAGSDTNDPLAALLEQAGVPLTKDGFLYEADKNTLTLSVGDTWMAIRVPDDLNDYDMIVDTFGLTSQEQAVTMIDMVDYDWNDSGDAAHD